MNRKMFLTLGLLAAFMLVACAPTVPAPAPATTEAATEAPTESQPTAAEPVAMPTSRGSHLMATDPSTVNLASGAPQLIEFFAFW